MASHEAFAVPILVTCLAVWQAVYFANIVSRWRGKLKIKAPLVTGDHRFECAFRAHQQHLERLWVFLPGVWLSSVYFSHAAVLLLGVVWLGARLTYWLTYTVNPDKRYGGHVLGVAVEMLLLVGPTLNSAFDVVVYFAQ